MGQAGQAGQEKYENMCEAPIEQRKRTAVLSKKGHLQRRPSKAPQKQDRLTNCVSCANTLAARCIVVGAGTSLDGVRAGKLTTQKLIMCPACCNHNSIYIYKYSFAW